MSTFEPIFLFAAPTLACLAAVGLIAMMLRKRWRLAMDHPNHRSLHVAPIPRTGGLGIMLGAALGWALVWPTMLWPIVLPALALSALSLLDDIRGLPIGLRFGVQLAAATVPVAMLPLPGGWPVGLIMLLSVVWMTNLYNFMDGSDGLAGGMALFGFGFYTVAAGLAGAWELAASSAVIASAALGFLYFNVHPAKIFMGDAGSIPLGFLAAGLGLYGWSSGVWPLVFPLLVFSPFIVDASLTLAKRLLKREKFWQAHRQHYYQRLVRMGLGHGRTAWLEYGLMLACGLSGLALVQADLPAQFTAACLWLALYVLMAVLIDKQWTQANLD